MAASDFKIGGRHRNRDARRKPAINLLVSFAILKVLSRPVPKPLPCHSAHAPMINGNYRK